MAYAGFDDTTTRLEDERLLYAGKYASYVHGLGLEANSPGQYPLSMISGMDGLGCGTDCNCPCNKGNSGLGNDPFYFQNPSLPKPKTTPSDGSFMENTSTPSDSDKTKYIVDLTNLASAVVKNISSSKKDDWPILTDIKNFFGLNGQENFSGIGNEPKYDMFPPGPKPEPYEWNGWKLVLLDGKWMYRNPSDSRLFVTPSNLYDMIGIPKDAFSGFPKIFADNGSFQKATDDALMFGKKYSAMIALASVAGVMLLIATKDSGKNRNRRAFAKTKVYGPKFGSQKFPMYKKGVR